MSFWSDQMATPRLRTMPDELSPEDGVTGAAADSLAGEVGDMRHDISNAMVSLKKEF